MPLGIVYRAGSEAAASYDWVDLSSGAGYKRYYACVSNISGGAVYILTSRTFDSSTTNGISTVNDGNGSVLDKSFDITFNVASTVGGGDAFVNITMYATVTGASITAFLQKVSGSTVTTIGSAVTAQEGSSATYRQLIRIPLTQTTIGVGDKLRLRILTHSSNTVRFYHDPNSTLTYSDQQTRTVGSDLTLDVPFKIQL